MKFQLDHTRRRFGHQRRIRVQQRAVRRVFERPKEALFLGGRVSEQSQRLVCVRCDDDMVERPLTSRLILDNDRIVSLTILRTPRPVRSPGLKASVMRSTYSRLPPSTVRHSSRFLSCMRRWLTKKRINAFSG